MVVYPIFLQHKRNDSVSRPLNQIMARKNTTYSCFSRIIQVTSCVVFLIERRDCNHICLETCCHTNLITGFPLLAINVVCQQEIIFNFVEMQEQSQQTIMVPEPKQRVSRYLGKNAEKNDNLSSSHVILFLCIQVGGGVFSRLLIPSCPKTIFPTLGKIKNGVMLRYSENHFCLKGSEDD